MLLIITSIVGLFKVIVTVIILFLLIRWISGLLFSPQQYNPPTSNYSQKKEETTVTMNSNKDKKIKAEEGEYVDYEEVD
jgi:hypothetical protein